MKPQELEKFPGSQPISDSVKNILKEYLKTDKLGTIDKTQNPYGFLGNLKKPFTILTWLSSKGVPASTGKMLLLDICFIKQRMVLILGQ